MTSRHGSLDVLFLVQGEGRGHMTQALALGEMLRAAGHRLSAVYLGVSAFRPVPGYFQHGIGAPVHTFVAPTLVPDRDRRGISGGRTTLHSLRTLPRYVASMLEVRRAVRSQRPDVVVNFYDLLAGFAAGLTLRGPPRVALAHCYLMDHPDVGPPPGAEAARLGMRLMSNISAARTERRLALSFDPLPHAGGMRVVPPLLRPGLEQRVPTDGGYLLVYALNAGYAADVAAWQARNPDVTVHCYVAGGGHDLGLSDRSGFHLHDLDDRAFLDHLTGCRAFVGTAGFEAACEAHYLGKPVLAVPVDGHYEQAFNARDMTRTGVARTGRFSDLDAFWRDLPTPEPERVAAFRAWVARGPEVFVGAVEGAAKAPRPLASVRTSRSR